MNVVSMVQSGLKVAGKFLTKNSPVILTILGAGGMIVAIGTAVKESKFVEQDLRELEEKELHDSEETKELKHPFWPRAKIYISNYWPTGALVVGSVTCLIFAQNIQSKRTAAALAAYQLSAMNLKEVKEKIIELDGEKKMKAIQDDISKDHVEHNQPKGNVVVIDNGEHLVYDNPSGRYFYSDIERVRQAVADINKRLYNETYVCLNDFYDALGLDHIGTGYKLGWEMRTTDDLLEITYSSQITKDGKPCLVLNYDVKPILGFDW